MSASIDTIRRLLGAFDPNDYEAPPGVPGPDEPRELVLYKRDTCPFCMKVFRMIDATGVSVRTRDVGGDPEALETLEARTGRATVPCLFIDDVPLRESDEIGKWLYAYAESGHGSE